MSEGVYRSESVYRLTGKKALVTGASRGIGEGIAVRLAHEGCDVVVNYVGNREQAEETRRQIESLGRKALVAQGDVSKIADNRRMVEEAWKAFGTIDFLVNNAGIEKNAAFLDVPEHDFRQVIGVNLEGPFFLTQFFVRKLKADGKGGRIVNISSVHEELPFPNYASYCMSKGAMKMMMRTLAIELAPLGITVNNIAPGAIKTPINRALLENKKELEALEQNIPMGHLGEPSDVAGLCAFLLSPDANYVTGATYFVDGGLTWNYRE